jgi:cytochrome c oxidase cbb3-type subunit III
MAQREFDELSKQYTTGHSWDGIAELDNPVPNWWIATFLACILVAILYLWLYPSAPMMHSFYPGLLGYSQEKAVAQAQADAAAAQTTWRNKIAAMPLAAIEADDSTRRFAESAGRAIFLQNCAPCHGQNAQGQAGLFPNLADNDWIWGGKLDDIYTTLQHGIRNDDPDSRSTQMPSFGADNILNATQIGQVADYVLTLRDPSQADSRKSLPGAQIFSDNCVSCHGDHGQGSHDFGAMALNGQVWLYGGAKEDIMRQVYRPRLGVMPSFGKRLDDVERKLVTVYVHTLGGGE